jgi:hypothetical protein
MFKPEKSKLLLLAFVSAFFILDWFLVIAPYNQFNNGLEEIRQQVNSGLIDKLPSDFVVSVKGGQVSTNKPSPYCLSLPDDQEKTGIIFDVDKSTPPDPRDLESGGRYQELCNPAAIVGQEYILFPDKDSGYRLVKVSPEMNFTANKSTIKNIADQFFPIAVYLSHWAYFIGPLLVTLFVYGSMLLFNFWYAFVAKFVSKIFKIKTSLDPEKTYDITLFYYTIITAIDWFVFGYIVKTVAGVEDINTSFFMRNTIIITLATLYYQSSHPPKSESLPEDTQNHKSISK